MEIALNKPIFIVGLCLMVIAFMCECMMGAVQGWGLTFLGPNPPGIGIPYIAILDVMLVNGVAMFALQLFSPYVEAKIGGIVALVLSIITIIVGIILILLAIVKLLIMVSLILAMPFGILVYLGLFGSFAKAAAATVLGSVMFLKIGFVVCLVLSQPDWLKKKGFLFIILFSLLSCLIVEFLHAIVPGFLCSVTDALGAIIVGIVGVIYAIIILIQSLFAIVKTVA